MKKIWQLSKEALLGAEHDYTEGSIGRAVILLSIPMVLEMVMESIFAITDIFFVGGLGPNAIATIGLTESLLTIVYTIAIGLSIGATAMMARRVGEGDREGASLTAVQTLYLGAIVAVAIGVVGVTMAPQLLGWMGGSTEVTLQAVPYMRVMFGGDLVILTLFLANAVFRGAGDGAIAMRALLLANGLNLLLVPCFVSGWLIFPKLGVTGAAWATTISRGVGAIYTVAHLFRGMGRIKIGRRHLAIQPALMWRIVKISLAGTVQVFIGTASWIALVRVVSSFGAEAVAGYTIGFRIILFALFPAFGMGNAAATMVGQSLGAKKPARAEQAVWITGFYNMIFLGGMGLLFVLLARPIVAIFTMDPATAAFAIGLLRTVASGFLFYAYGIVIGNSFNGAGDTATPTWVNFFVFWVFEIPLAYFLAVPMGLGPQGVYFAITAAFISNALVCAWLFRRGKWKLKVV